MSRINGTANFYVLGESARRVGDALKGLSTALGSSPIASRLRELDDIAHVTRVRDQELRRQNFSLPSVKRTVERRLALDRDI